MKADEFFFSFLQGSRRLLTYRRLHDNQVDAHVLATYQMRRLQIHEESSTGTADDLNAFRRQVKFSFFGGFSAREGAIINSFAYLVFSRLQGTAANVTCTSYKSLGCHASQGEVISVVGSSGSHGSWQSGKKFQIMLELVKEGFIHQVDIRYFQHNWVIVHMHMPVNYHEQV